MVTRALLVLGVVTGCSSSPAAPAGPDPATCLIASQTTMKCTKNSDCCTDLCENNMCQCAPSSGSCSQTNDCCSTSETCVGPSKSALGVCQ